MKIKYVLISTVLLLLSCNGNDGKKENADSSRPSSEKQKEIEQQEDMEPHPLNITAIQEVIGIEGTENNGEYKVVVPQNDLEIMVDGFKIIPPMGLGSWAAFSPVKDGAMVMGDIVVTEDDLLPVQQEVIRQGLTIDRKSVV